MGILSIFIYTVYRLCILHLCSVYHFVCYYCSSFCFHDLDDLPHCRLAERLQNVQGFLSVYLDSTEQKKRFKSKPKPVQRLIPGPGWLWRPIFPFPPFIKHCTGESPTCRLDGLSYFFILSHHFLPIWIYIYGLLFQTYLDSMIKYCIA